MKEKLALRKQMKAKKPTFLRQDVRIKKSLAKKWIKPKGGQSKLRRKFGGKRPYPTRGYRSPVEVRGLTPEGFEGKVINTLADLENLNEKAAIIASNVGAKKRIAILDAAKKAGIKILNIKDHEAFAKAVKERIEANKAKLKSRKAKKEAAKPKKEEKKKELSPEDQKKKETQEKKKIIETKQ